MFKTAVTLYRDSDSAAIVSGSSQIASAAIGAMAQSNLNNKTKEYNREMYAKQRADALSDWNSQNAYNSPSAQMERFKAAGLNENLIYGNNSTTAAPVRSSQPQGWNPKAPDYSGVAQGIGNAMNIKLQQAQLRNLDAQNAVIMADAQLKGSQKQQIDTSIPGITTSNESSVFDLNMKKTLQAANIALANTSVDKAKAELNNVLTQMESTKVGMTYTLDKNEREAAMNAANLKTAAENILNLRASRAVSTEEKQRIVQQIQNLQTSNELDKADLNLKSKGIMPSDNLFFRFLAQFLGPNPSAKIDSFINKIPDHNEHVQRITNP